MTFLRSMYPMPEESWLYRVRSTEVQLPDDTYDWLYFHAESGVAASAYLECVVDMYGDVIDLTTVQSFDEYKDVWHDLHWYDEPMEFTDEDDTSMLF